MKEALRITLWTLLWLVVLDVALGRAFPGPVLAREGLRGQLRNYFHYGSSLESKLIAHVERAKNEPNLPQWQDISRWGWPEYELARATWTPEHANVATPLRMIAYGNSFSMGVGRALRASFSDVQTREVTGPSAPPNASYALINADPKGGDGDVVVWGIVSRTVHGMQAHGTLNYTLEYPPAYQFPTYQLAGDKLIKLDPVLASREDFLRSLHDPALFQRWKQQMAADDPYYDPLVFSAGWTDHSVLINLVRNAWAQRNARIKMNQFLHDELKPDSQSGKTLRAMVLDFVQKVSARGQVPALWLFNCRGEGKLLDDVLLQAAREHGAIVGSNNEVCPSDNPANFVPDGHPTEECNRMFAQRFTERVRQRLAQRSQAGTTR